MKTIVFISSFLGITSAALLAQAQTINWGAPNSVDQGYTPRVAMNGLGDGVDVHQANSNDNNGVALWHFDYLNNLAYHWDSGANPKVAGDTSTQNTFDKFIEIHDDTEYGGNIWYRVMTLTSSGLGPGTSHQITPEQGFAPSVAEATVGSSTMAILAWDGVNFNTAPPSDTGKLHYLTGTMQSNDTVTWHPEPSNSPYDNGFVSSLATLPINGSILVVEVHQATESTTGALWSRTGILQPNAQMIAWNNPSIQYDAGFGPSVAICTLPDGTPFVLEVHAGGGGVWYRTATIDLANDVLTWNPLSHPFDTGETVSGSPSVACTGTHGIEEHALNQPNTTVYPIAHTSFTISN